MAINNDVSPISRDQHNHTSRSIPVQEIIAECRKILIGSLPKFFSFLDLLDEDFFTLSLPAENTPRPNDYLLQVRTLQLKLGNIRSEFTTLILDDFDSFWLHGLSQSSIKVIAPRDSGGNIKKTLIPNIEKKESSAISNIITLSESILHDDLQHLNLRFAQLSDTTQAIDNPISIKRFINHFQTVISSFITDHDIKLITYQQFGETALPSLVELYAKLNNSLFNQEILQRLGTSQVKPNSKAHYLVPDNTLSDSRILSSSSKQNNVDEIIQQLLKHYEPVPDFISTFIHHKWKHSLYLQYINNGVESPEWEKNISLMEQLLWSVTPKVTASDRKKLLAIIPTLLKSLRKTLNMSPLNDQSVTSLLKKLQQYHIQILHKSAEEGRRILALNTAKQLQIGTWLELTRPGKNNVKRIKLSWRSQLSGRCIFVGQDGVQAFSPTLEELANWFQQEHILIVK